MLCIIVPNRRTISPESFSWVRTRRLLSRHSCLVRSPSFPNQTKELPMSRRFGRYQQEQFNLHWENSVSEGSECIINNKKFKMRRRQEIKNIYSLTKQTTTLHVHHAFTFLCRHCRTTTWKCLVSRFVKDVNKQWVTKFSFSLWTWIWLIEIQLWKSALAFNKVSELE